MKDKKFSKVETKAVMGNGKIVTSYRSYPQGISYEEMREIDEKLVKAFGISGSQTRATFQTEVIFSHG
jgi:hypothetical protein